MNIFLGEETSGSRLRQDLAACLGLCASSLVACPADLQPEKPVRWADTPLPFGVGPDDGSTSSDCGACELEGAETGLAHELDL